jgi:hypothetical protein
MLQPCTVLQHAILPKVACYSQIQIGAESAPLYTQNGTDFMAAALEHRAAGSIYSNNAGMFFPHATSDIEHAFTHPAADQTAESLAEQQDLRANDSRAAGQMLRACAKAAAACTGSRHHPGNQDYSRIPRRPWLI